MFQIVAVWNICAFLMSMASLYSLSPGFHPSSASLSSPESLRNCTMMPQSSKGDRPNLHVGLWSPHPLADGIHARRTFLSGQACFRFWRRWTSFPSPPILKARLPLSPSHMDMPFSSQVCHPLRSYIYSRSFGILFFCFYISLFSYFLISLYIYISIQSYKNIIVPTYKTTVLYLYFSFLLFLYLCFHICFYCSTSLFY